MKKRPVIAALLVLTLMFTLITAAVPSQAATELEITLKKGKELPDTFWVGKTYNLEVRKGDEVCIVDEWKSSDKTIARITSKGKVTPKKTGKVKIKAHTRTGKNISVTIKVRDAKDGPEGFTLSKRDLHLKRGEKRSVTCTFKSRITTEVLVVKSENEHIARANVENLKKGFIRVNVYIFADVDDDDVGTTTITVIEKANSKISDDDKSNKKKTITVRVRPVGEEPEEEPDIIKITFDANGGSFPPGAVTEKEIAIGEWIGDLPEGLERDNYDFRGWATTEYAIEADVTFYSSKFDEDTTLYAVWEARPALKPPTGGGQRASATPVIAQGPLREGETHLVCTDQVAGAYLFVEMGQFNQGTLTFQWYKDREPIAGATGSSLTIGFDASSLDASEYYVKVTNTEPGCKPTTVTSDTVKVTFVDTTIPVMVVYNGKGHAVATGYAVSIRTEGTISYKADFTILARAHYFNDSHNYWDILNDVEHYFYVNGGDQNPVWSSDSDSLILPDEGSWNTDNPSASALCVTPAMVAEFADLKTSQFMQTKYEWEYYAPGQPGTQVVPDAPFYVIELYAMPAAPAP